MKTHLAHFRSTLILSFYLLLPFLARISNSDLSLFDGVKEKKHILGKIKKNGIKIAKQKHLS